MAGTSHVIKFTFFTYYSTCNVVSFSLFIRSIYIIFPLMKGKTSEYGSNNERKNDDGRTFLY